MSRWIKNDRTNTIQLLGLIVGLVILAYWATVSLTARDPLWFASEFEPGGLEVPGVLLRTTLR